MIDRYTSVSASCTGDGHHLLPAGGIGLAFFHPSISG